MRYPACVRVLVSEPSEAEALIDFLWERHFLGVRETRTQIAVAPASVLLPRASLFRLRQHVRDWNAAHPGAEASVLN